MLLSYLSEDFMERYYPRMNELNVIKSHHLLHKNFLIPVAEIIRAFCEGMKNSFARNAVTHLLSALLSCLVLSEETYQNLAVTNVGGGSPGRQMLRLGFTGEELTAQEAHEKDKRQAVYENRMHVEQICGSHTPVTDVSVEFPESVYVEVTRLALSIKFGRTKRDADYDMYVPWLQGLSGLQHNDDCFSCILTPYNAKIYVMILDHLNHELNTEMKSYDFVSAECKFEVKAFLAFMKDMLSIFYHETSNE